MKDLEMAKKRDHKIMITDEAIKKVPRIKMMVVVTNFGGISYLVKGKRYAYENAIALFNDAVSANNEARDLKGLRKAADHFLKNCHTVGIDYDNR